MGGRPAALRLSSGDGSSFLFAHIIFLFLFVSSLISGLRSSPPAKAATGAGCATHLPAAAWLPLPLPPPAASSAAWCRRRRPVRAAWKANATTTTLSIRIMMPPLPSVTRGRRRGRSILFSSALSSFYYKRETARSSSRSFYKRSSYFRGGREKAALLDAEPGVFLGTRCSL